MSRHSLKNTLRQVRGARNAAARTGIRYAKNALVSLRVSTAIKRLNEAESELIAAIAVAQAGATPSEKHKRAA